MQGDKNNTAAIYVRISSDPTGERAGVQRQHSDAQALADRLGLEVVTVLEDNDQSAYSGAPRPAFEQLLTEAAEGEFAHVIVWASDRLYRRMSDLLRITDELAPYVTIHTVMGGEIDLTSAEGIMRAQVLGSVAEFESRRKGERVAARAKQRAKDGVMTAGHRPRGWEWNVPCPGGAGCRHQTTCNGDGHKAAVGSRSGLHLHPVEAPIVAEAYQAILDGESLLSAWRSVTANGIEMTTSGGLRNLLLNPRNAGLVAHKGQLVAANRTGERIIDEDTYRQVVAILTDPTRRTTPGRPANTILGGGMFVCGKCGSNMASFRKHEAPAYVCVRNHCHHVKRRYVDAPALALVGQVLTELTSRGLITLPTPDDDQHQTMLRDRIQQLEQRLEAMSAAMASGDLDPIDYGTAARKIRAALDEDTKRLARRSNTSKTAELVTHPDGPDAAWQEVVTDAHQGNIDAVRAILRELLTRIVWDGTRRSLRLEWQPNLGLEPTTLQAEGYTHTGMIQRQQRVAELFRQGLNINQMAAELGVYRATIRKDLRHLGLRSVHKTNTDS